MCHKKNVDKNVLCNHDNAPVYSSALVDVKLGSNLFNIYTIIQTGAALDEVFEYTTLKNKDGSFRKKKLFIFAISFKPSSYITIFRFLERLRTQQQQTRRY